MKTTDVHGRPIVNKHQALESARQDASEDALLETLEAWEVLDYDDNSRPGVVKLGGPTLDDGLIGGWSFEEYDRGWSFEEYDPEDARQAACSHPKGIDPEDGCVDCGYYAK